MVSLSQNEKKSLSWSQNKDFANILSHVLGVHLFSAVSKKGVFLCLNLTFLFYQYPNPTPVM